MSECWGCGQCCEVIPVRWTKKELRAMDSVNGTVEERDFLAKHWHRISKTEAKRRNPNFGDTGPYYECDAYDWATKKCTVHETGEQPYICRGFPYYDGYERDIMITLENFPKCSFWNDVLGGEYIPLAPVSAST